MSETPLPYRIVTPRVVMRCWELSDTPAQLQAITESQEHLRPWLPWAQDEPTLDKQLAFLRGRRAAFDAGEDFTYGIFTPSGDVIGGGGLHSRRGPGASEIGYWVHQAWAGRGIATEISAALTRIAFEVLEVDRVEIHVVPDNVRSARVAEKLGFVHEATLRRRLLFRDQRLDDMIWVMFADQFAHSVAAAAAASITAFDPLGRQVLPAP